MTIQLPLGSFGTRHYAVLLASVVATLGCMALPTPYDQAATFGFSMVIVLQIRLLGGVGNSKALSLLFRLLGWMALGSLWLWLMTPHQLRSSGLPLLLLLVLFEVQAYPRLVKRLSEETRVTTDVLTGALSGYMLLGLTAALVMALLESMAPNSFEGLSPTTEELTSAGSIGDSSYQQLRFMNITYFAFVTITTLGYGDVLPTTPLAKLSTILFSVVGPVYLAVILGVLIGRYIEQEQTDS